MNMNIDLKDLKKLFEKKTKEIKTEIKSQGIRNLLVSTREEKVKRRLKQSEKGIFMIVGSLIIGMISYTFFVSPQITKNEKVSKEEAKSMDSRLEIEAQIENKNDTEVMIFELEEQLNDFKNKYPNYRTENEVLSVLNEILTKNKVRASSVQVVRSTPATKGEIANFINTKGLTDNMDNKEYFGGAEENTETPQDTTQEGSEETEKALFEYTKVTLVVSDISQTKGFELLNQIHDYERVILPDKVNLTSTDQKSYTLEATLLFYAYRPDEVGNLS